MMEEKKVIENEVKTEEDKPKVPYYAAFRDQTLFTRYEKDFKQYLREMRPCDFEYKMYHLSGDYKYNVIGTGLLLLPVAFLFGGFELVVLDLIICFFSLFIPVKMKAKEQSNYFIRAKCFCSWMERKYGSRDWYTLPPKSDSESK